MQMNKYRSLDELQKGVRISIMDMIIEEGRPVNLSEVRVWVSNKLNLDDKYVNNTLEFFIEKNIMVVDDEKNINFIYPVSAIPTMHKVTLADGREFSSMCAIDALGCRCTFNQDISIKSMCCVTGNEVEISVVDDKVDYVNNDSLRILHLNLDKFENWAANC